MEIIEIERKLEQRQELSREHYCSAHHAQYERVLVRQGRGNVLGHTLDYAGNHVGGIICSAADKMCFASSKDSIRVEIVEES